MAEINNKINQFERAALVTIDAGAGNKISALVHVQAANKKELHQIHFSVRQGTSGVPPATNNFGYFLRVIVCTRLGNLNTDAVANNLITPINLTLPPSALGGSTLGDIGVVKYDQVHLWPYSSSITFRQPMDFDEGEDVVVLAGYPVAQGAASDAPVSFNIIHLSARGRILTK